MHLEDHLWGSHWKRPSTKFWLTEQGESSRSAVIFLDDYEVHYHKEEFCDSQCLRYEWSLTNTSQTCNCAATLTVCHAMVCHMGGFTTQHSKIWDITASLVTDVCHMGGLTTQHSKIWDMAASSVTEVCYNVTTKAHLQLLIGKWLTL